jgi:hypothetical protein
MYHFAIVALMALAVVKVVDFLGETMALLKTYRSLLTFVLAIAGVIAIDYSMFDGFGVAVRNDTVGIWMTGFAVAGLTVPWRALFGWLTHDRAASDETLGEHRVVRAA